MKYFIREYSMDDSGTYQEINRDQLKFYLNVDTYNSPYYVERVVLVKAKPDALYFEHETFELS